MHRFYVLDRCQSLGDNAPLRASGQEGDQTLAKKMKPETLARVTPASARKFILELANLADDKSAMGRFERKFADFLPAHFKENQHASPLTDPRNKILWSLQLRNGLRNIWDAPDVRTREWGIFRIVDAISIQRSNPVSFSYAVFDRSTDGRIVALPRPTRLETIFAYLFNHVNKLRVCPNPECPARYFVATRKGQKYCSEVCSLPAQREYKRRWWSKNGGNWRRRQISKNPFVKNK
jgi:hypothetical protein